MRLAAECTLADAGDLKARLARLLALRSPVALDASAVQRVDTASLQVLAAFVQARSAAGRPLAWTGATPAFTEAAQLLGMSELLALPATPSSARS